MLSTLLERPDIPNNTRCQEFCQAINENKD
jgi:hypothetical protein